MPAQWISFKDGVFFSGFSEGQLAIMRAAQVTAPTLTDNTVFITSAEDGRHGVNSMHFGANGIDIRTHPGPVAPRTGSIATDSQNPIDATAENWCVRMRKVLGPEYQVIYEPAKRHIHVERDRAQ